LEREESALGSSQLSDDETLFAAFLCLRHQPLVIVCYRSDMQQELYGVSAETREAETEAAMEILGCPWRQWPILDTTHDEETVEGFMWGLLDPVSDDTPQVFAPLVESGGNLQHNIIGTLALKVFGPENVTRYSTYTSGAMRSRTGTEVATEPEWLFRKHAALACYRSQITTPSARHFIEDLREYIV
jgi:LmbE family N-acetylglucosaminyl deacetylase